MMRWQRVLAFSTLALTGALALLSACGGGDTGPSDPVSPTPTEEPRTVTSDDGKLTLEIPPGALDEEIAISITAVPLKELPEELQVLRGAGAGYRLEPDGLQFSEPVAVSLELERDKLEDEPTDGITAYALASLTEDGKLELLDELRTEASLGEDTVVVRGELSHFSWITRTKGSLVVSLEKKQREQPVGATFTAKGSVGNGDFTNTVTLESPSGTFLAFGTVSTSGDTTFDSDAELAPGDAVEGTGTFQCGQSPGLGTYTVQGTATSVVVVDNERRETPLTVTVDGVIDCVAPATLTPTPTATATPAPTATPSPAATPTPTPEPSAATLSLDCDHRIPNVESDVIVTVSGLQAGQTVSGSVTGPGVIGEGTFSAVANASGTAEARVPIDQFGPYDVTVDGLSGSINVGDVCPQG